MKKYTFILIVLLIGFTFSIYFLQKSIRKPNDTKELFVNKIRNEDYISQIKKIKFSDAFKKYNYSQFYDYQTQQYLNNLISGTNEDYTNSIAGIGGNVVWEIKDTNLTIPNTIIVTCKCYDNNKNNIVTIDFLYDKKLNIAQVERYFIGDLPIIKNEKILLKNSLIALKYELQKEQSNLKNDFVYEDNQQEHIENNENEYFENEDYENEYIENVEDEYFEDTNYESKNIENEIKESALFTNGNKTNKNDKPELDPSLLFSETKNNTLINKDNEPEKKPRKVIKYGKPKYKGKESGVVVVDVKVDRNGKVVNVKLNPKGTTTLNSEAVKSAIKAAYETIYEKDENAPEYIHTKLQYRFNYY